MTLTQRLFILVAIALLPAIVIQAYNELDLRRSREQEVRDLAVRQAQLAASELDQIFAGVRNLLTAVAEVPSVRALDTPACVAYLATLQPKVPYLLSISALDLEGRVVCRQEPPPKDLRFADRPYFQEAIATGGFVIGEYTEGRVALRPVLPLALPLRDQAGAVIGVVAAALDLRWLTGKLKERGLAKGGSVTVADRNGVILARDAIGRAVRRHAHPRPVPAPRPRRATRVARDHEPGRHAARARLRAALAGAQLLCQRRAVVRRVVRRDQPGDAPRREPDRRRAGAGSGVRLGRRRPILPAAGRPATGGGGSLARRRLRDPDRACRRTGRVRRARRGVRRHGRGGGPPAVRGRPPERRPAGERGPAEALQRPARAARGGDAGGSARNARRCCAMRRRCRPWACSPAAWRTTSTTC